MIDEQRDLFKEVGKARRDAGMNLVEEHSLDWHDQAIEALRRYARMNAFFTAGDFSLFFLVRPHHPNAWGPLWRRAKKEKIIMETSQPFITSPNPTAHARRVPVYKSLLW